MPHTNIYVVPYTSVLPETDAYIVSGMWWNRGGNQFLTNIPEQFSAHVNACR